MSIVSKRFSIAHIAAISLIVSVLTSSATLFLKSNKTAEPAPDQSYSCQYQVRRIDGYQFIKPILFVDEACQSKDFASVKYKIKALIEKEKSQGNLISASVYLRSKNQWLEMNGADKYEPGSLFKIPILMAILKMSEDDTRLLDMKIAYNQPLSVARKVNIASKTLTPGNIYSVRELLEYMIKYSDNQATLLVETLLDIKVLHKLFTDLGLEAPNMHADKFFFTPKEYSLFLRSIYNASYLTPKNSEYAAQLLGQSDFSDGFVKGLPANTRIAHKFGETGDENIKQLHESAIVYIDDSPYLLTVMTRGTSFSALQNFLAETSKTVYDEMKAKAEL